MTTTATTVIDVREIAPRERHALIFSRFDALGQGGVLQLVNDHDPVPLRFQFEDRAPGQFDWSYLEQGPEQWRVQITKRGRVAGSGSCCGGGACGG